MSVRACLESLLCFVMGCVWCSCGVEGGDRFSEPLAFILHPAILQPYHLAVLPICRPLLIALGVLLLSEALWGGCMGGCIILRECLFAVDNLTSPASSG